ncbi:MAG TPA: TPM domain-containing protein [Burkholderiales bacterium]|nr:TPM domain-containing protein [Burkholderiales bacterium]
MDLARFARHFFGSHHTVRAAFPEATLGAIERAIGEGEKRHSGQIEFAIEASLPIPALLRGLTARERALEWFARLRVWDTEHNSGVLVYLLLADRRIEIVADRGIHSKVGTASWEAICGEMQRRFAQGRFEEGVVLGVRAISDLLAAHFPRGAGEQPNELPDRPVVL